MHHESEGKDPTAVVYVVQTKNTTTQQALRQKVHADNLKPKPQVVKSPSCSPHKQIGPD